MTGSNTVSRLQGHVTIFMNVTLDQSVGVLSAHLHTSEASPHTTSPRLYRLFSYIHCTSLVNKVVL